MVWLARRYNMIGYDLANPETQILEVVIRRVQVRVAARRRDARECHAPPRATNLNALGVGR